MITLALADCTGCGSKPVPLDPNTDLRIIILLMALIGCLIIWRVARNAQGKP